MKFLEELGLAIGVWKVFDLIDSSTNLKKEQTIQVQLQNENMMLRNQLAQMQAQQTIEVKEVPPSGFLTLADVPPISREANPHMTDADWQLHLDELNAF